MRFASLGSGSKGNALLIETGHVRVLVDCGFPAREIERRLGLLDVAADSLDAILITHEHSDHVSGLGPLTRRYKLPAWMTAGTYRGARCAEIPALRCIDSHAGPFSIGDLEIIPYPVPHDAREPCQFVFRADGVSLGLLTDAGHITPHIVDNLSDCDALQLEFNHDTEMLRAGPYPPRLQARVGGALGHLNNRQSLELLTRLDQQRLQHLVAAHLSEANNTAALVRGGVMLHAPQLAERLTVATQRTPTTWLAL
ncbi:MAG: MBL fold metallo-hydrolase [endosymbiont of Seepiophila jonesi]|uniref:MBL fold metallo-hydrolase n=1 Tax=endosymbiont of Lamellibrachia luymesi TaxID=2200907 RepID=A0A370E257_9GAMM|nr:MAG: MBL fold metallo-hydrolase [endosymbiont of Seepiophila jonesi]RDH93574.1 MAG: MBL fold metallo-hydrolase [endosymbiont of Lamellibrachia luymesi]